MSEHVAIMAGAGGELCPATAEKLPAAGFTMVRVDRNEEALKELPDSIRREAANPTDPAAARNVVDRIAAEAGPPEMLVNTIGTYGLGEALTATPEDLRLMIDVNVGAALWLNQAVSRTGRTAVRVPSCTWPPARAWSRRPGWPPTPSARRPWSTSPGCSTGAAPAGHPR
jgi:NADP-dependent 3-hydroxy acid dehydrogenase YdfG